MSKELSQLSAVAEQALANMGGDLSKSLTTGYNIGADDRNGGNALRRESLAEDIKLLTYGNQDFTIYPLIDKIQANSTVEQYTVQDDYGQYGQRSFTAEIGLAAINDVKLSQKLARMKYITDTRQASLASLAVNNVADPIEVLQEASMMVVAKTIEYGIFYGNADLSSLGEGQGLQFDGLQKLIDAGNVVDAQGESLSELHLNTAATRIAKGFGLATDAFMPVGVQTGFINNQLNRQWIAQATGVNASGVMLDQFVSARGRINLHGSTIMGMDTLLNETEGLQQNAPAAPIDAAASVADGKGNFQDQDIAAGADYKVRVAGATGPSVAVATAAKVAKAVSEVTLDVTVSNITAVVPDYVEVFRKSTKPGDENYYLVGRVPMSEATTDAQGVSHVKFVDTNAVMPATSEVYVLQMSRDVLALYELIPMLRLDLPSMVTARSFAVAWAGALALFAPKKAARIKNVAMVN